MPALTYCFSLLGEATGIQHGGRNSACWGHVGTFFALGRLFFALGWFLNVFCTFLAHVGRFFRTLGRPGLDFGSSGPGFRAFKTTFDDVFWRSHARVAEMLIMQQNHNFCDVLSTSEHAAHSYRACFLHSLQSFFGHGVWIAAKNPCWHSLAAFHNHPAARRYVRSTWN